MASAGRGIALEQALGKRILVETTGHGGVVTEFRAGLRDAIGTTLRSFDSRVRPQNGHSTYPV